MTALLDQAGVILTLHQQGKSQRQISEFLKIHILAVRHVVEPDYAKQKQDAARNAVIRREHLENTPQRVREFVTNYEHAAAPSEPRGTFLDSPEGREALERVQRRYRPERLH